MERDLATPVTSLRRAGRQGFFPYLFLAPAVALLLALTVYPLLYIVRISLYRLTPAGETFVGGENFLRLVRDPFFFQSLGQTFLLMAGALTLEFFFGLALALLLDSEIRARGLWRALLLLPMILPPVVVGVIWRLIYNPNFGVLNGALQLLGVDTTRLTWLADPSVALAALVVVDVWEWTPFVFLILLAGLQAIPEEPYEAARIDGSSAWQTFRHITLPLLAPAILVALLLRTMDLLRLFDQVFILTQGGPGFATETISLYIYKTAFRFFDFGYAAAMSLVLLVATLIVSRFYLGFLQKKERPT
ncbi:MAG TPA: sugar ABC transporter permease [Candidatus Acidoferrales bacterium]|nr:sugar ABC transporter permease [Candidatus Acidoferrales bacterium]